jgi:hypothetical protein
MTAVATVIRSRRRSSEVPPDSDPEPPNMSESPLPFPECSRMNTMRNSELKMHRMSATTLSMEPSLPAGAVRALVHDGAVRQREVAGDDLPGVGGGEHRLLLAASRQLGAWAPWMEAAARGRVDR